MTEYEGLPELVDATHDYIELPSKKLPQFLDERLKLISEIASGNVLAQPLTVSAPTKALTKPLYTSDRSASVLVEVLEQEWRAFRHVVLIGETRLRITNQSNSAIRLKGLGQTSGTLEQRKPWMFTVSEEDQIAVHRETYVIEQQRPQLKDALAYPISPGDKIEGWAVTVLDRHPAGGTPRHTFFVEDALGNEFEAVIPDKPAVGHYRRSIRDGERSG